MVNPRDVTGNTEEEDMAIKMTPVLTHNLDTWNILLLDYSSHLTIRTGPSVINLNVQDDILNKK